MNTLPHAIPSPAEFRAWIAGVLPAISRSAAGLSREAGLHRNTLGDFLKAPDRGLSLSSAHAITCKAHEIASAGGIALPGIGAGGE